MAKTDGPVLSKFHVNPISPQENGLKQMDVTTMHGRKCDVNVMFDGRTAWVCVDGMNVMRTSGALSKYPWFNEDPIDQEAATEMRSRR